MNVNNWNLFSLITWLSGFLILISLACCAIPFPIPSRVPYPKEVLNKLSEPGTTKIIVRNVLGEPQSTRLGGRYWFYANIRDTVGIISEKEISPIFSDYEWIGMEFDRAGHLMWFEHNESQHGCLKNGICSFSGKLAGVAPDEAPISAPTMMDAETRVALISQDECGIYFYTEPSSILTRIPVPTTLLIDGRSFGVLDYHSYLFIRHPAGVVRLKSYQYIMQSEHAQELAAPCKGGEKLYIQGISKSRINMAWVEMSPVEETVGKTALSTRKLALPF